MKRITFAHKRWIRFWGRLSGTSSVGRMASRLAAIGFPPYHGQIPLAQLSHRGFTAPGASVCHALLKKKKHVFIGDGVFIYQDTDGGAVTLDERVKLIGNCAIQTGQGGSCHIGERSTVQPFCQFSAYLGAIEIGSDVEIAPHCSFYPYDHGTALDTPIPAQPLQTKGGIVVEKEVWLGVNVIVLDGVRIGRGAVVGAGSVVKSDLPEYSISVGNPARVVKMRS